MNSMVHFCLLISFIIIFLEILSAAIIPLPNYYGYGQSLQSNDNSMIPELPPEVDIPSEFGSLPSSSPPPDFFSDLNFSKFPDFEIPPLTTDDVESPERNFPEIKGTYTNSDIGFQVDLPKDWKGKEIKFLMNMVFAAPQEINLEKFEEPQNLIIISGIDQKILDTLTDFTKQLSTFKEEGGGGGGSGTGGILGGSGVLGLLQGSRGQLDMPTSSRNIDECKEFQTSLVTINGISAEQSVVDCVDEQGKNIKAKSYVFATQDDALIIMVLVSKSTNEYNQYLPLFEESVKTIKISNPGDIATSEIYKKYKELELQ
jgi:hypothetical protein